MPSSQRISRSIYPPSQLLVFLMREAHTVVAFSEKWNHDKTKKHKIIQQLYNVFPADKQRERERSSSTGATPCSVTEKKKPPGYLQQQLLQQQALLLLTTSCKLQQLPMPPCKLKHRGNNHYQKPASKLKKKLKNYL